VKQKARVAIATVELTDSSEQEKALIYILCCEIIRAFFCCLHKQQANVVVVDVFVVT